MSNYNAVLGRNTENAPKGIGSFSQTVAFSHYNNLSAQLPIDPKTGKLVAGDVTSQATQCFKNIEAIVQSIEHEMTDVVRITIFLTNIKDLDAVDQVYRSFFTTKLPTRTVVVVDALPMDAMVQVDTLITCGEGSIPNAPQAGDLIKLTNQTTEAPSCPLSSQVVSFSHYCNVSAQLPIDPKSGRLVGEDIKIQTAQCLKNIKSILQSIDVPFDDIVKMNIFLTDLSSQKAVDEVYTTFFPDSAIARAVAYVPARTVIPVQALPMGALVQMEAVVSYGDGTPPQLVEDRHGIIIEANNTPDAPVSPLCSQTVAFSHYNHLSGQLPLDPRSGKIVAGGIKEQTIQCLNNVKAILENVDHKLEDIVKVNLYLKDLADFEAVTEVYSTFFPSGTPAGRVVGVGILPESALIQIDVVAGNEEGTPPQAK